MEDILGKESFHEGETFYGPIYGGTVGGRGNINHNYGTAKPQGKQASDSLSLALSLAPDEQTETLSSTTAMDSELAAAMAELEALRAEDAERMKREETAAKLASVQEEIKMRKLARAKAEAGTGIITPEQSLDFGNRVGGGQTNYMYNVADLPNSG